MKAHALEADSSSVSRIVDDIIWIDTLDKTSQRVAATDAHQPHTQSRESEEEILDSAENIDSEEVVWLPPRDSNPDMLIQSQH